MEPNFTTRNSADVSEIGQVVVQVPVRHPGNAIAYKDLKFEVVYDGGFYSATPIQDDSSARLTGLSRLIKFKVKDDWVTCQPPALKYVAVEIYQELKKQDKLIS